MLPSLRAEKELLEGDSVGAMTATQIRDLGIVAWGDKKKATRYAAAVYRERLLRGSDDDQA